jgi:hypothetical protein
MEAHFAVAMAAVRAIAIRVDIGHRAYFYTIKNTRRPFSLRTLDYPSTQWMDFKLSYAPLKFIALFLKVPCIHEELE